MSAKRSYLVFELSLHVECEDERLGKKAAGFIDDYFFMTRNNSQLNSHHITLRFKRCDAPVEIPKSAKELAVSPSLCVLKGSEVCYLIRGGSTFRIDLANSIGIGFINSDFWTLSPKFQQEFLMLSILWLLRNHEIYAIHANALVKDNVGVLFIGGSGSGKSTAAISLIRQGWSYLSDDVILLRNNYENVEATAFTLGF